MQFATSVSTSGISGSALPRVLLSVAVGVLLLVASVPAVYAAESNGKGPDITGLKLDRWGADIADVDESAAFQGRGTGVVAQGPDITTLNLDQYGADIADVDGTAGFQMLGEPSIIAAVGQYLAGPHDVAGGDEGRSFPTSPSNDRNAAIFHLCEIDITLQLTSECR
jgi:hypothetical protein